jgi:hypothetical protein
MARQLRKRGPAGRFLLVTLCIRVSHRVSIHSNGYGHIADSVQAERAVRITARFAGLCPFCPLFPGVGPPRIPIGWFFAVLLALGGGLALFVPAAGRGCRIGLHHLIEAPRGAGVVPPNTGDYRDIRANMERT